MTTLSNKGFTLVELMITAAVLSVVSSVILAVYNEGWDSFRAIDVQIDLDTRFEQTVAALRQDVPRAGRLDVREGPPELVLECPGRRIVYTFAADGVRRVESGGGPVVERLLCGPWASAQLVPSPNGLMISGEFRGRSLTKTITASRAAFVARRLGATL